METIILSNWQDYVAMTHDLDGWAFRGQENALWPPLSSLSRHLLDFLPDKALWRAREERATRIFRRKAHNYLSDARVLEDDLRCLAMIQHHGGSTRLIDFTKSPFVAAFFALERAVGDSAVFALNTPRLWNTAPLSNPTLTRQQIDPRIKGNLEKYFYENIHDVIWMGEPSEMDQRLVAQSGTFVMPGVLDKPIDRILDNYPAKNELIKKIVLPRHTREDGLRMLYRMNITNASLFPDLEGLAKSIRFELEVIWQGLTDRSPNRMKGSMAQVEGKYGAGFWPQSPSDRDF
ncbi:MAG: FRG domain-containing protein [Burkholderiales bacterium]|nr:FRG domain-containing protein [Burkholderiales bacterium]